MGQRLVTTIEDDDGNKILNCYMHWSAYTGSTLDTAKLFADEWKNGGWSGRMDISLESRVLGCALKAWERSGVVSRDLPKLGRLGFSGYCAEGDEIEAHDRNSGLIAVSEKEMAEQESWAEGDLRIYVQEDGSLRFWTDVYWTDDVYKLEPGGNAAPEADLEVSRALNQVITGDDFSYDDLALAIKGTNQAFRSGRYAIRLASGGMFRLIA